MDDLALNLIINERINNSMFIDVDKDNDNTIYVNVVFKSIKDYLDFLKDPNININYFSAIARNCYKDIVDAFCNNTSSENFKLIRLIRRVNPCIKIKDYSDINILVNTQIPFVFDICELNFTDKVKLLTENDLSNYLFYDKYNEHTISDYHKTREMYVLLNMVKEAIKDKNFSETEMVFYIYNLLKNRIYKDTDDTEDKYNSRSLVNVISSDSIVCSGFVNYFNALCDIFGIKSQTVHWKDLTNKDYGHASSIVYINDAKYNILGIWGIDTTWDSKKSIKDGLFRMNLKHFLLPCAEDEKEKNKKLYQNQGHDNYYELDLLYKKYLCFGWKSLKNDIIDCINEIYVLLNIDYQVKSFDNIEEEIYKIKELGNRTIPYSTLKTIINTVDPTIEADNLLDYALKTNYHYKSNEDYLNRIRTMF